MFKRLRRLHPGSSIPHIAFYDFCRRCCLVWIALAHGIKVRSIERLPTEGAVLIVANHASFYDPPAIGCRVGSRHLDYIARATLFKVPGFGKLISYLNTVPINQQGGDTAAMKATLARLKEGRAVVIFPEGERARDGELKDFKRGAAVILKRSSCPVLLVAITGAFEAWPRHKKIPRLFKGPIRVNYGQPIPHAELMADGADAALQRLHDEVARLKAELESDAKP